MTDQPGFGFIGDMLAADEMLPPEVSHKLLKFEFPGPAARAFFIGDAPYWDPESDPRAPRRFVVPEGGVPPVACDLIMGPEGSGKTTTANALAPFQSLRMPTCVDGVKRARGIITRDNYRSLTRTTLPSWFNQFPKDLPGAKFEGGQDRPGKYSLRFQLPNGGPLVEMEVLFFGIDSDTIENLLKGLEPSWGFADEADLQPMRVLTYLYGRTGRYPAAYMLPEAAQQAIKAGNDPRPRRVWGTLNPPSEEHWVHEECIKKKNPFFRLHRQPSGLSHVAENRKGVSKSKYEQDASFRPAHEVRRFVHGNFGFVMDGELVFPQFSPDMHIAPKKLEFEPNYPLVLGLDQGGRPALAILQPVAMEKANNQTQLRLLREVVTDPDQVTGLSRFAEMLREVLETEFRGARLIGCWADPAGFQGADKQGGEFAWAHVLGGALGMKIQPCWTNEVDARLEGVGHFLGRMLAPGVPAFLVSPECRRALAGFTSRYVLKKQLTASGEKLRPFKNEYADIQDAIQYGIAGWRGRAGVLGEAAKAGRPGDARRPGQAIVKKPGWRVFG